VVAVTDQAQAVTVEVPADRVPCPRCEGLGHLDPNRVKGACLGTWWDLTVESPVERVCGKPVPDREHGRAGRRCAECRRQEARLAELREAVE
jgi:RecJ-like exonuclease